jgi:type VI secretion system protein ImpJ
MEGENRVVWAEGMFLRPQHFQQQDRYVERLVRQRVGAVRANGWGLTELAVDRAALAIGKFGLAAAAGVLDDGTPFDIPGDTPTPAAIDLTENTRNARVMLVLPMRRAGQPDTLLREREEVAARYAAQEYEAPDGVAGSDLVAPIQVGSPRIRLAVEGGPIDLGGYACLPVARVLEVRGGDRQVLLDDSFIPPAMSIGAAPLLAAFVVELQGLLTHRAEALAARMSAPGVRGAGEMANLLMLQAVNRFAPQIAHLAQPPRSHPEDFFELLVGIAGELATFTLANRRTPAFPIYRHDDLSGTYAPVIAALRQALSQVLQQGAEQLPLQERRFGVRVSPITNRELLRSASFVLAARADLATEQVRRQLPASLKIGPVEQIAQLVNVALPGIGLAPLPVAPPQLPYIANTAYFEFDRSSQHFRDLANSGGIAIHVSGEWPGLALELWAIRTS